MEFPTISSNAGANVELMYKNTLSPLPTLRVRRRYATTASNRCAALILHSSFLSAGALPPTGLKRTTTFWSAGNSPAVASAAVASRGSCVSITDADMVSGRSGDGGDAPLSSSASGASSGMGVVDEDASATVEEDGGGGGGGVGVEREGRRSCGLRV
ncbi:hypothetical protein PspLS_03716 [Pyricularia sp. CBS 133598]|nr:hypothetical protein PspLS_03716 [Pyricularia sp. CBS 133598]